MGNNIKLEQGDRVMKGFAGQAPIGKVGHNYGVTRSGRGMLRSAKEIVMGRHDGSSTYMGEIE